MVAEDFAKVVNGHNYMAMWRRSRDRQVTPAISVYQPWSIDFKLPRRLYCFRLRKW